LTSAYVHEYTIETKTVKVMDWWLCSDVGPYRLTNDHYRCSEATFTKM